jgi:hypothetical protein
VFHEILFSLGVIDQENIGVRLALSNKKNINKEWQLPAFAILISDYPETTNFWVEFRAISNQLMPCF